MITLKTTYKSGAMVSAVAIKKDKAGNEVSRKLEPQVFDLAEARKIVNPAPGKVRCLVIAGVLHEMYVIECDASKDKSLAGKGLIGLQLRDHVLLAEPQYQIVDVKPAKEKAPREVKATASAASVFGVDLASEIAAFAAATGADEDEDTDETGADA